MKLNKIVLVSSPTGPMTLYVTDNFNNGETIDTIQCFYESMEDTLRAVMNQYNVDEVMVIGAMDYIQHIGKQMLENFPEIDVYIADPSMKGVGEENAEVSD